MIPSIPADLLLSDLFRAFSVSRQRKVGGEVPADFQTVVCVFNELSDSLFSLVLIYVCFFFLKSFIIVKLQTSSVIFLESFSYKSCSKFKDPGLQRDLMNFIICELVKRLL